MCKRAPMAQETNVSIIVDYFGNNPYVTFGYVVTMLAFPLGVVVIPAVVGSMVDNIKDGVPFSVWKSKLLLIVGLLIVMIIAHLVSMYMDTSTSSDFKGYIRSKMFNRVIQSRVYDYEPIQVSSLMAKLSSIPFGIFDLIKKYKETLIPGAVTMVAVIIFFFYIDVRIGAVVLALLIGMVGIMVGGAYASQDGLVASEYGWELLTERQGDILENIRATVLTDARQQQREERDQAVLVQKNITVSALNTATHFTGIVQTFVGVFIIGVILYSYVQMKTGSIGTDQMMSILFVLLTSRGIMFDAMSLYPLLLQNNCDVIKLGHFLSDYDARINEANVNERDASENTTALAKAAPSSSVDVPVLEFDNVSFAYRGKQTPVFENATFSVMSHDYVLVRGPIGSGKSTMAVLANGLHRADKGTVRLLGKNINLVSRQEISKLVVYVPQRSDILNASLFENIALGTNATKEEVALLLKQHNIDFIGIDKKLGKGGSKLSGGQQLMVALMRALIREKTMKLLIADEITANLDSATTERVVALLETISKSGVAVVFISHSPPPLIRFTKILELDRGLITSV
jgi:ABC-type multidrug transport system fused ATPase/permease subunit